MRFGLGFFLLAVIVTVMGCGPDNGDEVSALTPESAARFADLALDCIHREYPNKLNQVLADETRLKPPRELHPAFYGCFDWHSSVHGHWMLVKLMKTYDDLARRDEIAAGVYTSLSPGNIAGEVDYFESESRSWERTYGWAWLLKLATELDTWDDPLGDELSTNLAPLVQAIRQRYLEFLPVQEYPVRTGVHPNTAFGLSFAFDYAKTVGDTELTDAVEQAALRYYANDRNCPIGWEPSGEDFLSPCLEEAALMSRVLPQRKFDKWLEEFLPGLDKPNFLAPARVSDRSDPKIAHLDGVNLSRAWNLFIIADAIDYGERTQRLRELGNAHLEATLPNITSEHYEGSHWLGSFAVYALTR
ncbi:MAG: DUF2891 domain-containing protein [Woeseiaceae bacterium]|nr:DUF2891 domain-containing protein [Woeseiaceae bacterium]